MSSRIYKGQFLTPEVTSLVNLVLDIHLYLYANIEHVLYMLIFTLDPWMNIGMIYVCMYMYNVTDIKVNVCMYVSVFVYNG